MTASFVSHREVVGGELTRRGEEDEVTRKGDKGERARVRTRETTCSTVFHHEIRRGSLRVDGHPGQTV